MTPATVAFLPLPRKFTVSLKPIIYHYQLHQLLPQPLLLQTRDSKHFASETPPKNYLVCLGNDLKVYVIDIESNRNNIKLENIIMAHPALKLRITIRANQAT